MNEIDFDGCFGMLVGAEHLARDNKRAARGRDAKVRINNACIEDIDFTSKRKLERPLLRQLATCAWDAPVRARRHDRGRCRDVFRSLLASTRTEHQARAFRASSKGPSHAS